MTPTAQAVEAAMIQRMRYRDRVCFASRTTIARDAGCSPRTVQRAWRELEHSGRWSCTDRLPCGKRVKTRVWSMKPGCDRGFVSQRTTCRTPNTSTRYASSACARRGRRRRLMEQQIELVERRHGEPTPFGAGDVIAAVVTAHDLPVGPRTRARLGREAKGLLAANFDPLVVCSACLCALQASRPHLAESFANEILMAQRGQAWSWSDYRRKLKQLQAASDPGLDRMETAMRDYFAKGKR